MNKLCVAFLLLLAVCFPYFQRPWHNDSWISGNPNIWAYGVELWWNVPAFQASLDGFGVEEDRPRLEGSMEREMEAARAAIEAAGGLHDACIFRMITSFGAIPFGSGSSFMGVFSKTSECTAYREKWKLGVDSALRVVEGSLSADEKAIAGARESYSRLVFSGVCGSEYSGPGSGSCGEIQDSLLSVDNNITEGDYGKYALALAEAGRLRSDLLKPAPGLSSAKSVISLAWGDDGIVESYRRIQRMADLAQTDAKTEFQASYKAAALKQADARSRLDGLRRDELDLIERAPSGSRDAGSVDKRFSALAGTFEEISLDLSGSKILFERTNSPGYLSGSVSMAAMADEGFGVLIGRIQSLEEEAERAVSEQEDEAIEEISDAEDFAERNGGAKALESIRKAQSALSKSKSAGSLGLRFAFLSEAAALARSAKNGDAASELSRGSGISALEDLIIRAEKDGINVASEKESLSIMKGLPATVASEKAEELSSSIVSRARLLFEEDLMASRSRILEKISLGGEGAADLSSDLRRVEKGLVSDGELIFPGAIGSLSALESGYASLEEELEAYQSDIVGNAMSASASPLILEARLDSPSEIILDLVLTNPTGYSSKNAQVKILLGQPVPFVFSEISQGKDEVGSLRMSGGDRMLILTFVDIGPFETKRVAFSKKQVIGRKISEDMRAEGLGDGSALFSRTILFELDTGVGSVSLPDGIGEFLIDGEAKAGPLSAGKHTLRAEGTISDAYSQSVEKVRAYGVGLNSKVEFDLAIEPRIDLEKAAIFIDSLNDSSISSFDIVSVTGEPLKNQRRVSDTRVAAETGSLRKGRRAVFRVSYLVDDTKAFVENQLSLLEGVALSENASDLIGKARAEADSGNYPGALEALEKSKAAQEEDAARAEKSRERFLELSKQAERQIDSLESAVSGSILNDSFIKKLGSRKSELERALSGSNESDFRALEGMDQKWLSREIGALRKELYKRYNDLKERFFLAGNSSTPAEFQEFEESLIRLESAESAEYSVDALQSLDKVAMVVELQEKASDAEKARLKQQFQAVKSGLLSSWDRYSRLASEAKGTDYSGMFPETERSINSLIKEAESLIGHDPRSFLESLEKMNSTRDKLDQTIQSLKSQSESRISLLEAASAEPARIDELRRLVGEGEYVNALRSSSSLLKETKTPEEGDQALPIIGVTALAILGAAGFYMMKPKKELRKLNAWRSPPKPDDERKNASPVKL